MRKEKKEIIDCIIKTISELGIWIDYDGINDFDLSMYMEDSISFISALVMMEEALEIEFPEELLFIEAYTSFQKVVDILYELQGE